MQEPEQSHGAAPTLVASTSSNTPPAMKVGPLLKVSEKSKGENQFVLRRLGADLLSAAAAATLVSPLICIIDKGIMENASGRNTLVNSLKTSFAELFSKPHHFLVSRPFRLVYMLYFGTYCSANFIDTSKSVYSGKPMTTVSPGMEKFAVTSSVNMGLCLYKDRCFAQLFSTTAPRPVPLPSYILFSTRDILTIFFSFNVPPLLAPYMPQSSSYFRPETIPQILAPAACQIFSTPLHLLGLDLYNRGEKISVKERWNMIRRAWAPSALARMGRIIPAFGFGGVTNTKVRRSLMEKIQEESLRR